MLFTIYSGPIADIARNHELNVHLYADDTQLYFSYDINSPHDELTVRSKIEKCVADIKSWMTANKLKLNDEKTELIMFTTPRMHSRIQDNHIQIANAKIQSAHSARNLGIFLDENMTMADQIKKICQSAYFQIRNINSIRKILSDDTASILVHALITSRLDNGNALLYGISNTLLDKLQRTQNAAARVLSKTRKYDHITPTLIELHWLPVRQRIQFKILLLTWKSLNGLAPSYISQLLTPYVPTRTLRSSDKLLLKIPKTFSSYGDRAFSSCAPKLWNSLPMDIRSCVSINAFKNRLKTYLFQTAYNV